MGKWKDMELGEAIDFNPPETIKKGVAAKKIPMEKVIEFQRKISGFEVSPYSGGPKFRNGDTLLAKITPCLENGKTAQVDILEENEVAFGSTEFIVLRSNEHTIKDFVFYLAKSPVFRKKAISCMEGTSGRKRVNDKVLKLQVLPIPDISTQQKIAAVLSALDAKIELNARINAELESMAKTLYDYWFVQTKKVGKLKVGKLGDFIEVNARSITKNYSHSEIEYIDIASVSTGRLEGTTKYEIKDAPSRARRLVKHGDTIWSTVRPNRKSYLFICNPSDNLVVSTGFAVLTPKNIPPSFLYFFTTTEKFVNYLVSNAEGSAYPAVSADRFAEIDFEIPHERKLVEFENIVSPVLTKISKNELESQTLTELRDWLLPMLMNGQVQVQT